MSTEPLADPVFAELALSGSYGERRRPAIRGLVVDEQPPGQTLPTGQRQRPEVDSERHPQFATRGYPCRTTRLELSVEADRLLSNGHCVAVLVGKVEPPMVFDVGLIPRNSDANRDRDLLRSRSDHPESAAKDEEFAIVDLYSVCHQDDGSEGWRVEGEVGLLHCDDPIGFVRAHEATR